MDTLGAKFKQLEQGYEQILPANKFVIVRLDGKNFHTIARKYLIKPFDARMIAAHKIALYSLLRAFNISAAYIQSDEASIILKPLEAHQNATFNNRLQKLISIMASTYSVHFTKILSGCILPGAEDINACPSTYGAVEDAIMQNAAKIHYHIYGPYGPMGLYKYVDQKTGRMLATPLTQTQDVTAIFDARAFVLNTVSEVREYITWRRIDAIKNAKMMLARTFFSHKQLLGIASNTAMEMVYEKYGVNYAELPPAFKVGVVYDTSNLIKDDFTNADFCNECASTN